MSDTIPDDRNIATAEDEWDNGGITFSPGDTTHKLVRALLSHADTIDEDLEAIRDSHHLDNASGQDLDRIGSLVDLDRKQGEDDDKYRARIRVQFRVGNIGTTFDEFAEFTATLLNTDVDNIEYVLPYGRDPATVQVSANPEVYDDVSLTTSEVNDFLGSAVPAGHEVNALEGGTFRLKSDGEGDDPSKGLTSDSIDTGGTLAQDIE